MEKLNENYVDFDGRGIFDLREIVAILKVDERVKGSNRALDYYLYVFLRDGTKVPIEYVSDDGQKDAYEKIKTFLSSENYIDFQGYAIVDLREIVAITKGAELVEGSNRLVDYFLSVFLRADDDAVEIHYSEQPDRDRAYDEVKEVLRSKGS